MKALKVIALGLHKDYGDNFTTGWEGKYRTAASELLGGVEQFEFIITFVTVYEYMSRLEGITVKLQSTSLDIIETSGLVVEVKGVYKRPRETVDSDFAMIYNRAVRIFDKVVVQPTIPWTARQMQNRANALAESV